MSRRKLLIFAAVIVLLALNVWRWQPQEPPDSPTAEAPDAELQELQLRVADVNHAQQPMRRDLFYRVAPPVRVAQNPNPTRRPQAAPIPVKSAEELALEQAQAEFAAIRVIGIVFRNGRGQAYLETGGKSELVGVGDTFGAFKVTAIRQDSVELNGTETAAGGRIPLAGS